MTYRVDPLGLERLVAGARPGRQHAELTSVIRGAFVDAVLATTRSGYWLRQRKVLTAAGELIADDHASWLAEQLDRNRGDGERTVAELSKLDLRLTKCDIVKLYLVHDTGSRQQDFVQIDVEQEDEFVDRRLFSRYDSGWRRPRDAHELVDSAENGEPLPVDGRQRYRPTAYSVRRAVDFAAFLDEAVAVEGSRRVIERQRIMMVTDVDMEGAVHAPRATTVAELDPSGRRYAWKGQRLVDDWTTSSAGRSGARLCRHWVFQFADHTSAQGQRAMDFVPIWTFGPRIAAINRVPEGAHALYAKLEAIDRRTGVPMGWYFWMLHGNRVTPAAGERVLEEVEAGRLALPENDYQVLRRWSARPYGF